MSKDIFLNSWIHDIKEVEPGNSAILGGNKFIFYGIHIIGMTTISISFISCIIVIINILFRNKKEKWDFSDRFPLYLAVADGIWGLANLTGDHIVLLITQTFPEQRMATALSINLYFFLGYQQLMQGGLASYTYLKIVRRVSIDLGKGEWKLHVFVLTFLVISISIFLPTGAFGCSGYWFLLDVNKTSGKFLAIYISTTCTTQAMCTIFGYRAIKGVVDRQKRVVSAIPDEAYRNGGGIAHYHSTATNCLNTFVYISCCIYAPLAFLAWVSTIELFVGIVEPFTALCVVLVANSSGWVNAWGYFHNKGVKKMRRRAVPHSKVTNNSTSSTREV